MIDLELQGDPTAKLDRFLDKVANPGSGEVRKVGDAIRQGYQGVFSSEGGASGPWRQLAPLTVILRAQRGFGGRHPILVQTGRLRSSFVQRGATDHIDDFQKSGGGWILEVGSKDERAADLHFGTPRIPPRPIVDLTQAQEDRIISTIDFFIDQIEQRELRR